MYRSTRRVRPAATAILLATCALGPAACGDDEGTEPSTTARSATTARTFVGEVGGRDRLIAIVTEGAGDNRTVRAYVCSRASKVTEWFAPRPATGDRATLTSDDGDGRLELALAADGASGTVAVDGGRPVRFSAPPAQGIGGLYDVKVAADGSISGRDRTSGIAIRGRVGPATSMEVTFTPDGGKPVRFPGSVTRAVAGPGTGRLIHLDPDGRPATDDDLDIGTIKSRPTAGTSTSGYTWWEPDF